jgi:hypothetical protein
MRFNNRLEAGRLLAGELTQYAGRSDVVVLALPRGGVPDAIAPRGRQQSRSCAPRVAPCTCAAAG